MRRLLAICAATATLLLSCTGPDAVRTAATSTPDDAMRPVATSSPVNNEQGRSAPSLSTPSTSHGDPVGFGDVSPRSCRADELLPRLTGPTQDVVALGEPITVSIELENGTSEPCARPIEWSITVSNSAGVEVIGIMTVGACIDPCQLLPGEHMTLAEDWEQIGFDAGKAPGDLGQQYEVGPGDYVLDVAVRVPGLPADESVQRFRRAINVAPGEPAATGGITDVAGCRTAGLDVETSASGTTFAPSATVEVIFTVTNAGRERCFLPVSHVLRITNDAGEEVMSLEQHGDCMVAGCEILESGGSREIYFEWIPRVLREPEVDTVQEIAPADDYMLALGLLEPDEGSDRLRVVYSADWSATVEISP